MVDDPNRGGKNKIPIGKGDNNMNKIPIADGSGRGSYQGL